MRPVPGPEKPVEAPLFCPNGACENHDRAAVKGLQWYYAHGCFRTQARGTIRRFKCKNCGKTCSTQTFSIDYWTHGLFDYADLLRALDTGAGLRHTGRYKRSAYSLIQNRIRRLARNCLAVMDMALVDAELRETVVMDGLESYLRAQYFPCSFTVVVGSKSQFVYGTVMTALRRKGRMTAEQKARREMIDVWWRPVFRAVINDCTTLLNDLASLITGACRTVPKMTIFSDKHSAYPPAIAAVKPLAQCVKQGLLRHKRISADLPRTVQNPLFPVNYVDRQIRKNMSDHARETVKQAREANCAMERMAIFNVLHNYLTPHRISNNAVTEYEPTHSHVAGHRSGPVLKLLRELTTHRHVFSHCRSGQVWIQRVWQHQYDNPPGVDFETGNLSPVPTGFAAFKMPRHFVS